MRNKSQVTITPQEQAVQVAEGKVTSAEEPVWFQGCSSGLLNVGKHL